MVKNMSPNSSTGPLSGVIVVDLTQILAGPVCTMFLADMVADVIKVENPAAGEPTRNIGLRKGGQSIYFRNTQRGKRSLTLNLKHEAGREILLRLAETADVLVESFRPGVVNKLGVGPDSVRQRAPRMIYCSISAFGQEGTMSARSSAQPMRSRRFCHSASVTNGMNGCSSRRQVSNT